MLIECIVGIFILTILVTIIYTITVDSLKSNARRKELKVFNENVNILEQEISLNEGYCEIIKLKEENKKWVIGFEGEYLIFQKGDKIEDFSKPNKNNLSSFYEIEVISSNDSFSEIKIAYKLDGKGKSEGERIFKKYRFIESQEGWIYSS
ncbi:MAG: hypothetical protein ACRC2K_08860 [Clostridium sp.]